MKSRQQKPALAQMFGRVEKERRPLAHKRAEWTIRFASMKRVGIAKKNLADRGRIAGEDEGRDARHTHGEPIAVAARAGIEESKRIADEIESREEARAGRQGGRGHQELDSRGTRGGFHTSFGRGDPCTQY